MLDSLDIKNYRNLKTLRIKSLGRVNLITGKNNTGKSTILEAIAIFASKADINLIYQLLEERGEYYRSSDEKKNFAESNIRLLSSLFTNRNVSFEKEDAITIGSVDNTFFGEEKSSEESISIRFVRYFDDLLKDHQGRLISRRRIVSEDESDSMLSNDKLGIEIKEGKITFILPLDEDRLYRFGSRDLGSNENVQFIRVRNIDREINGKLFDSITLTEKEHYVIEALKIIEPNTERIAFVEETPRQRAAVIKLSNSQSILPLLSMGDGMNRILTIILALVSSDNGYLLIDEFENGLHHSVQERLWKIIFELSEKLNVQIFATTHSEDCIFGFENILNSPKNKLDGKLIRLDNDNGTIKQVEFNAKELKIANDQNIETR
jgi:AAA15 family ATPase/GTPase